MQFYETPRTYISGSDVKRLCSGDETFLPERQLLQAVNHAVETEIAIHPKDQFVQLHSLLILHHNIYCLEEISCWYKLVESIEN